MNYTFPDTEIFSTEMGHKFESGNQEWVIVNFYEFTGDMKKYGMGELSIRKARGQKIFHVTLRNGMMLSSKEIV